MTVAVAKLFILILVGQLPLIVASGQFAPETLPIAAGVPPFSVHGVLNLVYADDHKGAGGKIGYLSLPNQTRIKLRFSVQPSFAYFARSVVVSGDLPSLQRLPNGRAEKVMTVGGISLSSGADAEVTLPSVSGTRKMIVLLLQYSDDTAGPFSPSYYSNIINMPAGNSVNAFYQANSWGALNVQADVTPAWLILPKPKSYYAPCGWSDVCADLNALASDGLAVGLANGVNFANYEMISFVLSNDLDCCAWGGGWYGTLNGVTKTWGATWMPPWAQEVGTYSHEVGHSIGLPHSGWVYYDYDSPWDVMSSGNRYNGSPCGSYSSENSGATRTITCYTPADTIAPYKDMMGWIDTSHLLTVAAGSTALATVDSLAAPMSTSYKMIKVCITGYSCTSGGSVSRYLAIEARTHYGYDQFLPGEGIIIHMFQGGRPAISGSCFFISDDPPAYPVDSTPSDWNDATCNSGGRSFPNYGLFNAQWFVGESYGNPALMGSRKITIMAQTGATPNPVTYTISIGENTVPLSSLNSLLLDAPSNTVYFIFPDSNTAHAKPPTVGYAQVTDWTALGYVYGALANMPQITALDTNTTFVDPATGAPKIHDSIIVLFASRLVNSVVYYYEVNGFSPLYWGFSGSWTGTEYYYTRSGSVAAQMSIPVVGGGTADMPLIEVFKDQFANTVIIFSGFGWKATFESGLYFKTVLQESLTGLTDSWYFWSWQDLNGDGFPDWYEVNPTPVSHGN